MGGRPIRKALPSCETLGETLHMGGTPFYRIAIRREPRIVKTDSHLFHGRQLYQTAKAHNNPHNQNRKIENSQRADLGEKRLGHKARGYYMPLDDSRLDSDGTAFERLELL
jgi:hypothetical protein